MGTRNLTCVQKDNKIIIAKYCQWDGYPDGQGRTVVDFIKNKFDKNLFIEKLKNVKKITSEELDDIYVSCGAEPKADMVSMAISDKVKSKYPHLSRDMGGEVLEYIQNSTKSFSLINDQDFANNSLFCEYAYVLNLDDDCLDIYVGFQTTPSPETSILCPKNELYNDEYYPVKKLISFSFQNIKTVTVNSIVKKMEKTYSKSRKGVNFG